MADHRDHGRLRVRDGRIHYFLYQQDGSKQPMSCPDTPSNRHLISWFQIHDSPTTGKKPDAQA